ncbi:MAG: ATP-dependent DNA helicase [Coraliomargaritaceae bacterium]
MIGLIENTGSAAQPGYLCELVEAIFQPKGHLQSALGLEHRPEQADMAQSVASALEADSPLLFEAGTGVGKSLAYLIPGLLHAIDSERPFIVSSHTIALQEQIREKDLKICRDLFQSIPVLQRYAHFKTAVMLGRANYCCTTRLANAIQEAGGQQSELLPNQAKEDLIRLRKWAANSENGVLQELTPPPLPDVWDQINADSSTCSRKNCDPAICFHQRARKKLFSANCIVLNHSLLFSLINAGMPPDGDQRGILLPEDFVVLDEAHRIPSIATDHFGLHISSYGIDRSLKRLYNPRTRRGQLKKYGSPKDLQAVENAIHACDEFFQTINETSLRKQPVLRIRQAGLCQNIADAPLREVTKRIDSLIEKSDNERLNDELGDHRRRIAANRLGIHNFIELAEEDHVYWVERGGKHGNLTTLRSAPLDVAPHLQQALFQRGNSAILTSATLSDGQTLDNFCEKVGGYSAETEIRNSPFDYENNCRIFIASDTPEPEPGKGRLDLEHLAESIVWCSRQTTGGTLVLFTSHQDLRAAHQRTADAFRKINRPLYCQGIDGPRSEILECFRKAGNGILFGTDSFWTGIDIPGPSLSQVILTRLPFENPGHPLGEARYEYIRSRGGNPFADLAIPEALTKFRQGLGRLIRCQNDHGHLIILDSRLLRKPYGRHFLQALPQKDYYRFEKNSRKYVFEEHSLF